MKIDRIGIKGANDNDFVMLDDVFELYPVWRTLSAAVERTSFVTIPGMNGALDCSEEYGEVFYDMRTLNIDCVYIGIDWHNVYSKFSSRYHGRSVQIMFANDPAWYWTGRLSVSNYNAKEHKLSMKATVFPYKLSRGETVVISAGNETVTLRNGRMTVTPTVTIGGPVTLAWGSYTKALSASSYPATVSVAGLQLLEGDTKVTITGAYNVEFRYRGGAL